MNNFERKKRKEYRKMCREHKKAIMDQAKLAATDPFDGEVGLYVLIEHLKFMRDYYKLGYNVVGSEAYGRHSRLEWIEKALSEYSLAYDENDIVSNKYFYLDSNIYDETGKLKFPENYGKPRNDMTYENAARLYNAAIDNHKHEFFKILAEEMDNWWD